MEKKTELLATHQCQDESGKQYTVEEYVELTKFKPISGPESWLKGIRTAQLEDVSPVNWTGDDDIFQILETGVVLRRIASTPNA